MLGDIALTLFFVFLNGFFVAAEFAIVKVRSSQIEIRAREGNFFAGIAKHILEHLDAYLSASQLGITLHISQQALDLDIFLNYIRGMQNILQDDQIAMMHHG